MIIVLFIYFPRQTMLLLRDAKTDLGLVNRRCYVGLYFAIALSNIQYYQDSICFSNI